MNFKELLSMPIPDDRFVAGSGLIPAGGLIFVGGPPKSYKSFLLFTMGIQLSCGLPLFGAHVKHAGATTFRFPVVRPLRVLIVEQELGWVDDRERLSPMYHSLSDKHKELICNNLYVEAETYGMNSLMRLDNEVVDQHRLSEAIGKVAPDVLILDPLSMFHRQDENSAQDMGIIMRNLAAIRTRHKLMATIVSHHTSKPRHDLATPSNGPDLLRGSSVLFATGDSYIMVSPVRGDRVRLDFTLRRHRPITSMIASLNDKSGMVEYVEWTEDRQGSGRPSTKVQ